MAFLNLFLLLQVFYLMIFGILNQLSSQTSMIYLAHLSTNTALRCLSLNSLSNSCALTLPLQFLHTLSPHDTILTKHQAFAPSSPMLVFSKFRLVRLEFCCKASARAWQERNGLRNTMKHTAHMRNLPVVLPIPISRMLVPGSKNT